MEAVRVLSDVIEKLADEVRHAPQIECCGLLAGREDVITTVLPVPNALTSATAYEIAPEELLRLFKKMRDEGLAHLGIYHSHPRGPNIPSPTDVKRAYYPDVAYFIVSPAAHVAHAVRAFRIRDGRFAEIQIVQP